MNRRLALVALALIVVSPAIYVGVLRRGPDPTEPALKASAEELVSRAELALERGDTPAARLLIDEALSRDPDFGKAILYQGQFLNDDGRFDEAIRCWARIPEGQDPISGTARYLEGMTLLEQNRAREAEQRLQAAIRMHPEFCAPYHKLAELYLLQLRGEAARRTLREARLRQCLDLAEFADELLAGKPLLDEEQAIERLQEFAAADPDDQESLIALARYHELLGEHARARQILTERLREHPTNTELRAVLAELLCEKRRFNEALELMSESDGARDDSLSAWHVHARLAAEAGQSARAAAILAYIVSRKPFDVASRFEEAQALSRAGQSDEAARGFEEAELLDRLERLAFLIRRGEDRPDPLIVDSISEIADVLGRLREHELAADWLRQGLLRDPRNSLLRRQLDRVLAAAAEEPPHPEPPRALLVRRGELTFPETTLVSAGPDAHSFRFEEVTGESGLEFRYLNASSSQKLIVETIGGGVAVLDYDGDGWPDLYFPQGAPPEGPAHASATDRLFRNLGGQRFVDVTRAAGLGDSQHTLSCTVGDVDSDGDPDVFLANLGSNALFLNNGDGTFTRNASFFSTEDQCSTAGAFADFDNDGLLDLYVVNYVEEWTRQCRNSRGEPATCDPRGFPPAADHMYRNDGRGGFIEISDSVGADLSSGKGLGVIVADLDGDGLPDIYVANDGTPNFLLRNASGDAGIRFHGIGYLSGTAVNGSGRTEAGMGIACSDFDNDGLFDLFVTNFYRETNTLYHNLGGGFFADVTSQTGLAWTSRETLGFGTQALDADLDGDDDLVIANGDIDDYSAYGRPWKMSPQAFRNDGGLEFTDVSGESGEYFTGKCLGRGMASLDFNQDGRSDLVVVHHDREAALLRNMTVRAGNWVVLTLRGRHSNRSGLGAIVVVQTPRLRRVLTLSSGDGYGACNEKTLRFGVGVESDLVSLEVHWPDGETERLEPIRVNRHLICVQGNGVLAAPEP
jgi:tetratricopeptide (TPR) repeat protein